MSTRPKKQPGCPICGKPVEPLTRPFCSSRCRDIDLGRWLDEDYRIPVAETPDELEDPLESGDRLPLQGGTDDR